VSCTPCAADLPQRQLPTRHPRPPPAGTKVFMLSDGFSGYIYNFNIYTGADNMPGMSGYKAAMTWLQNIGMELHPYRVLFTDNWYTTVALAIGLWVTFKMYICGNMKLTNKCGRGNTDFPYKKLSN